MKLPKQVEAEYRAQLAAGSDEVFGIALNALLSNELERVKELAITPGAADILTLQGEAQAYKKILKFLKERPASATQV
jgi:hypothetical protein